MNPVIFGSVIDKVIEFGLGGYFLWLSISKKEKLGKNYKIVRIGAIGIIVFGLITWLLQITS